VGDMDVLGGESANSHVARGVRITLAQNEVVNGCIDCAAAVGKLAQALVGWGPVAIYVQMNPNDVLGTVCVEDYDMAIPLNGHIRRGDYEGTTFGQIVTLQADDTGGRNDDWFVKDNRVVGLAEWRKVQRRGILSACHGYCDER